MIRRPSMRLHAVPAPLGGVRLAALLGAGGCVTKKQLGEVETALARSEQSVLDLKGELDAMTAKNDDTKAALDDTQASLDKAEAELAALEKALAEERERRAQVLADRGALREEVAEMKTALEELEARRKQAEARVAAFRDLVSRFQSLIDAGTLQVRIIDGRMVVVLRNDVLFDSGSADLSEAGRDTLAQVSDVLEQMPDRRFQVEGHTDDKPIQTARYPSNWYLAAARAIHVVDHLVAEGVVPGMLSAAAFADTRPAGSNATEEGRAANRRIEIVVIPDLSELPGNEELGDL